MHLTVSDRAGDVVSYTFTIESTGGSGLVVPGFGFLLNNELTDFNFDSTTHPNRVEGGKRPRSSMSPTIRPPRQQPVPRARLPGRLDDHHDRPPDPARPDRSRPDAAAGDRRRAREPAQHGNDERGARVLASPEATALRARGHVFASPPPPEIGAATGIEFLGAGAVLAAAEPTRRGGGSAMVEAP